MDSRRTPISLHAHPEDTPGLVQAHPEHIAPVIRPECFAHDFPFEEEARPFFEAEALTSIDMEPPPEFDALPAHYRAILREDSPRARRSTPPQVEGAPPSLRESFFKGMLVVGVVGYLLGIVFALGCQHSASLQCAHDATQNEATAAQSKVHHGDTP